MTTTREHYPRRVSTRTKKLFAASAAALIMGTTLATPALTMPTGPGIREGKNISVFHNIDFIAAFGYPVGEELKVQVFRNGVEIGSAAGPAVEVDEGLPLNGALEVNHGPEGAPQPGDCWTGTTPNVLPGDRVVVTDSAGGTDEVLVDDIAITKEPTDFKATADKTDVVVEGHASYADGTPIPVAKLDSGELRQATPRFRAEPNQIVRIPGTQDGWRAIYRAPYKVVQIKEPLTLTQQKQAILNGDHAMGYGHVAPLPPETQLADGVGNANGPAPGCEASPAASYEISSSSHKAVNSNNVSKDLVLRGLSQDASAVSVKLNDRDPATAPLTATATPSPGSGAQKWSVSFPAGTAANVHGVSDLRDGMLNARATYTIAGGDISGVNLQLRKDTVAPSAPQATPAPGVYQRAQSVTLKAEPSNKIHYTQTGARPTPASKVFAKPIRVTGTQTIKAIAVDEAGNKSPVAAFRYVIR